jgi:hypothetical protein
MLSGVFATIGACEQRLVKYVRPLGPAEFRDMGWRSVADDDDLEPGGVEEADWPGDCTVLYWWQPTFWRPHQRR